jgi:hypothetical protein
VEMAMAQCWRAGRGPAVKATLPRSITKVNEVRRQ